MYIDRDKENISGEEKLGKYNILLSSFKIIFALLFILLQCGAIFLIFKYRYIALSYLVITLIAIVHLIIFNKIKEYKLVWLVLIILFPISGPLMYFVIGNNKFNKNKKCKLNNIEEENIKIIKNTDYVQIKELENINKLSHYKMYKNQGIEFFNTGEDFFDDLLNEIKRAKKSILIDIYILSKSELFEKILEILKDKVKEGVIVEIIYDGLGSMFKVPKKLKNNIKNSGIMLYTYKKINFNIADYVNHREHKKIILIDGKIGYTGGINIADEYINKKELHRIWKDGGIKIYGDVVVNYLLMYLITREEITKEKVNIEKYIISEESNNNENGFVFAYSDGPNNDKKIVKSTYINVANLSKRYLYIVTPYFIPSKDILNSIKQAANRGVDVKILLPHIPDKKIIQYANRSYYNELLKSGVRVYEYKKGFIHSKYMVSDNISLVGTANLDYRSLYFNFECMNLSYNTGIELKIKEEFEKDIKDAICIELDDIKKQNVIEKIKEIIARFLAPIL